MLEWLKWKYDNCNQNINIHVIVTILVKALKKEAKFLKS